MAGDEQIGQNEIEELLRQAQKAAKPTPPATPAPTPPAASSGDAQLGQADIEALLGGNKPSPAPATPQPVGSSGGDAPMGQDDIEALLGGAKTAATKPAPKPAAPPAAPKSAPTPVAAKPPPPRPAAARSTTGDDASYLLAQAEAALASVDSPEFPAIEGLKPFTMEDFGGSPPSTEKATLELLRDVELNLRIELGRSQMYLEDVLKLKSGSVVTLDKLAGDPVDVYVNGRLIARGEVLVLNDNFCVRVAELLSGDDRHNK